MDLYRIDPSLRKSYTERQSHFSRSDAPQAGARNDLTKPQFANNDILCSSAWSSVIHQPAQDSEPEDLPSTVDIDAIKEPPTPINASAQTPLGQLHGDSNSFDLNSGDSGSDTDSDSDSANSENEAENAASGADSGSYSDSDSASSHHSSCSSRGKHPSSRSSRSNTPPSNYEDQQQFSVRETNFEQGGLKLKFSALKVAQNCFGGENEDIDNSSDSSETKYAAIKNKSTFDLKMRNQKMYLLNPKDEYKRNSSHKYRPNDKQKFDATVDRDSDSDSSSSSNASPAKRYLLGKSREQIVPKINSKLENSSMRSKLPGYDGTNFNATREEKSERVPNVFSHRKNEVTRSVLKERTGQSVAGHSRYRNNKPVFLKLPQACKLSEDSDDSDDVPKIICKNETKKENNRDTIEKLAQQLTHPGNTSEHLQVLNEEDLAAILPDVENSTLGGGGFDITEGNNSRRKKTNSVFENKKAASSESSSDAEMLPKQDQIVRDAINSIQVDSDVSDESGDSSDKNNSSDDSSSSDDDIKEKPKEKVQYASNLLEAFVEKTEQLNKNNFKAKSKSLSISSTRNVNDRRNNSNETCRKRGRPPKSKISSMAEVEAYMRLDCTVSNVSPDSGIQSNSGSPLYHGLQSPARSAAGIAKTGPNTSNLKSLSLSQKAVLSSSKKNSDQRNCSKDGKELSSVSEVLKNHTNHLKCSKNDTSFKKTTNYPKELIENVKTNNKDVVDPLPLEDMIKVPPYLGSKSVSRSKSASLVVHSNLTLFQGKRGPGRPKKHVPVKLNGRTNMDAVYTTKVEKLHKSFDSVRPSLKSKYANPTLSSLENMKKRNKKKNSLPNTSYHNMANAKFSSAAPLLYSNHKEWLRKHKKRKKKETKEKVVNEAVLKEIENLVEVFGKKCTIADKKSISDVNSQCSHPVNSRPKSVHKLKDRGHKKRKHSDRDSESESNSAISVVTNDTKTKRRHKKSAIETPKILQTNCDQRLPLKKRHYHMSSSSITNNSHQPHIDAKVRNDKHVTSNESSSSPLPTASDSTAKYASKTSVVVKTSDNQKSKPELPKSTTKSETPKLLPKVESSKSISKVEIAKSMTKPDTGKHASRSEISRSSVKSETQKSVKVETSKKFEDVKPEKSLTREGSILVTPKKRHRLEEEKKTTQKNNANKVEVTASLPLRRSGRCMMNQTKKSNSSETKKKSNNAKVGSSRKNKAEGVDVDTSQERASKKGTKSGVCPGNKNSDAGNADAPAKRPDTGVENVSKRSDSNKTEITLKRSDTGKHISVKQPESIKLDECLPVGSPKSEIMFEVAKSHDFAEERSDRGSKNTVTIKDKNSSKSDDSSAVPPSLSPTRNGKFKPSTNDMIPVLDDCRKFPSFESNTSPVAGEVNTLPTVVINKLQTSNKPQLITPIPSEPPSITTSPNLKPPAGVFEPTRKLPFSLSRCKRNSIDDVLSKLQEKLKGLQSPMKNTSALIEKISGVRSEEDSVSQDRVLRSKRAATDKEPTVAKKSKLMKDVTVRLRKLSNSELVNASCNSEETKPKVKRRKTRNRTGFPVKKKKKSKKISDSTAPNGEGKAGSFASETDEKKPAVIVSDENMCPLAVKNEINDEPDEVPEEEVPLALRQQAPVLQPMENVPSKVKIEVTCDDEVKNEKTSMKVKPKKPLVKTNSLNSSTSSKVTPSRSSARIHIKKEMRAKELKKSTKKKKVKKAVVEESKTKETRAQQVAKESNVKNGESNKDGGRERRIRNINCETKDEEEVEKESKPKEKEETDKDDLSDDSVKCATTNKKLTIPKRKRKCVEAGLLSEYYKEDKRSAVDSKNRFAPFKPEDHPHGLLPPPPYFEDYVRRRKVDFKLPYDLWWLNKHNQLPGKDVIESWKYKRMRLNVYYDVKPTNVYETQACNCIIPKEEDKLGCGDDCINRVVYAECSPDLCPLKERCSNQRIQKHDGDKKLVKFMTTDKGIGVKTEIPIKCGEYIVEYVGEVITDKEFKKRMTSLYKNDIHHYCLNLDGGLVIDGHRMGSDARFVNHSCEPNCEIQKWTVNGLFRMALFAQRDIDAGEELTYDYNFALFNPEEGQPCRCGSSHCRGVIGGKSQRVSLVNASAAPSADSTAQATNSHTSAVNPCNKKSRNRPRKQIRKIAPAGNGQDNASNQRRRDSDTSNGIRVLPRYLHLSIPVKPLTPEEKDIVKTYSIFLHRSLTKVQRAREKVIKENSNNQNADKTKNIKSKQSVEFLMQLNALSKQRFIRTRGLAQAEDNPEMTKILQLANIFRTMYNDVVSAKDERDEKAKPFSSLFMTLPSKRKLPTYYTRIEHPIDLTTIEKNIITGVYKDVESFDADIIKLIINNVTFYGRISDYGIAAVNLRKAYNIAKLKYASQIQEIIGQPLPSSFMPEQEDPGDEEEDVIRCICGLFNDEGLMIQCERCLVWQHCECVRADTNADHYLCERCHQREVDYDIPLDVEPPEYPAPNEKHYLTLMRDDLQIRQGDTVYVLRDIPNPETGSKHTFRTINTFRYEDCDIFRVEQLWKTENGEKLSFGHHYLRPHETFHEPSRKFFPNEVMKVSLYETIPLDLIMGRCYVLDVHTFCKGRPIDSDPQHIYICEYRVDKSARLFFKCAKSKQFSVCTKNYAFEKFEPRLKLSRTYAPHGDVKPTVSTSNSTGILNVSRSSTHKVKLSKSKENASNTSENNRLAGNTTENSSGNVKTDENEVLLSKDLKLDKQKQRLNSILLKLLAKKSCKAPLDASYLLDVGRRNRKKPNQQTSSIST